MGEYTRLFGPFRSSSLKHSGDVLWSCCLTVTINPEADCFNLSLCCVSVLNCVFLRSHAKSTSKKQLSQKGRKSRKQDSSAEEDEEEDDDDDDTNEEDTPKRQSRRRGATKVKRCLAEDLLSRWMIPLCFGLHPLPELCWFAATKRTNMTLKRTPMTWLKWRGMRARSSRMTTARP